MIRFAAALLLVGTTLFGAVAEEPFSELQIMQEDQYPKVFFFRASEKIGRAKNVKYNAWDRDFSQLMGIMGKVLNNELLNITERGSESFKRFKQEHPHQIVLCHYNGNARDPRNQRQFYFDGHWMYYNGTKTTQAIPAQTGEMEIHVDNPGLFKTHIGRYGNANEDIGLCMLDENGKPDWHRTEQVKLVSVDLKKKTLTVKRAQFDTQPLAFPAGKAYAAAHMFTGPWGKDANLLWRYNYSITCPRDKNGQRCIDVRVAEIKRQFSPGGRLHGFDGLEFDVLLHHPGNIQTGRGPDCNADGIADGGMVDGRQVYGIGTCEYMRMLRAALGDGKLIMGDGHSGKHNRAFFLNNGIESEGWPSLSDHEVRDWSGGMNRHYFWQANAHKPQFNYITHKFEKVPEGETLPFSRHRLVFAAAMFTDAALTYAFRPPEDDSGLYPVWDEFRKGEEKELGWLGRPVGKAVHLADQSPDLLKGSFTSFVPRTDGITVKNDALRCTGQKEKISFVLKKIPVTGDNLTVRIRAAGAPMKDYPKEVARLMEVELLGNGESLITRKLPERGICFHGQSEEEGIPAGTGAGIRFKLQKTINGAKPAFFMHPPGKGGKGYTWFQKEVTVPADGKLSFYTAMGEKSPSRSDGVWFRVQVAEIAGDKTGAFKQLFEHTQKSNEWIEHHVSLSDYSGKKIALKFISDCGPKDNSTTDHSYWGSVQLMGNEDYGIGKEGVEQTLYMSYVNNNPFTSRFFFPKVNRRFADIRVTIEGTEPVVIESISGHAAPDAVYREFEKGLVLANPGLESFTFDLEKIAAGKKYRRFKATSKQDTVANNGQPVGKTVTLGAKDGLFLVREQ
ncbi:MAG: hypothetical protein K9M45_09005 [Kiritimatiellales bacterium]|nr:hypothetical protein [Kiritimatiellales bacterium]